MSEQIIEDKYKSIEALYGKEAVKFTRKIMSIFANAQGKDSILWAQVQEMYAKNDIILYQDQNASELRSKILLRPAKITRSTGEYSENAVFGFIDEENKPIFAEVPLNLINWDGQVNSLTTAILDIGRSFHSHLITDETRKYNANNEFNLANAFHISNRLSDKIRATKFI